jgi:hypothetical protein
LNKGKKIGIGVAIVVAIIVGIMVSSRPSVTTSGPTPTPSPGPGPTPTPTSGLIQYTMDGEKVLAWRLTPEELADIVRRNPEVLKKYMGEEEGDELRVIEFLNFNVEAFYDEWGREVTQYPTYPYEPYGLLTWAKGVKIMIKAEGSGAIIPQYEKIEMPLRTVDNYLLIVSPCCDNLEKRSQEIREWLNKCYGGHLYGYTYSEGRFEYKGFKVVKTLPRIWTFFYYDYPEIYHSPETGEESIVLYLLQDEGVFYN